MSTKMKFDMVIETDRLYLEKIELKHFDDLYSLLSNEMVQKFFPKTLNRTETKEFYDKVQDRYREDGYSFFAVLRKEDNKFVGICGLLKQKVENSFHTEIGYRFLNQYWGNGYATEAAKGCIEYVKKNKLDHSLIILSVPHNTPSIGVAKRCGFSFSRKVIFHDLAHELYEIIL